MRRVGFFGGSFDPIHLGHLSLAIQMLEIHQLDEILFCPTSASPHKLLRPPEASSQHRGTMVEIAIEPISSFALNSSELRNKGPSFTVDTLRALKEKNPETKYYLILGEDSLQNFCQWKEWEAVISLAPLLIGLRKGTTLSFPPPLAPFVQQGMTPTRLMDISSTEIRDRLKKKLYCGHLLPEKVETYIHQNKLYFT